MAGKPKFGGTCASTREEIAFAGGLFDGEGCITVYSKLGKLSCNPRLTLAMTDEDSVRRFANIVGVGHVRYSHPPSHKSTGRQPQWHWTAGSFEHVQHVLAVIWPWLCQRRKSCAVAVLRAAQKGR